MHHNDEKWSLGFFKEMPEELQAVEQRYVDTATELEAFVRNSFPELGIRRIYFVKLNADNWRLKILHRDGLYSIRLKPNCGYYELAKSFFNEWGETWLRGKPEDKEEKHE